MILKLDSENIQLSKENLNHVIEKFNLLVEAYTMAVQAQASQEEVFETLMFQRNQYEEKAISYAQQLKQVALIGNIL